MLKEIASLALTCAALVGFTPLASSQNVAYVGDVSSIDQAALRSLDVQAAGPAGFQPRVPATNSPQQRDDGSFLSKLKPAWLFGSQEGQAPVDPFAAATAQARASVVKPTHAASPIPAVAPSNSGVTQTAYSDRQRGGLNLRRSTSRSRGILSGVWTSTEPQQQPRTNRPAQTRPKSQVASRATVAPQSDLRPGVGSKRRWAKPQPSAVASRPAPAPRRNPRPATSPRPTTQPRQLAGSAVAIPLPKPAVRSQPPGDFLMVSDAPSMTEPAAVETPSKPKANPFVTAAIDSDNVAKPKVAAPEAEPVAQEKKPSIIAAVRPAVPPAVEATPPVPQPPVEAPIAAPAEELAATSVDDEPPVADAPTDIALAAPTPVAEAPEEEIVTPPTTVAAKARPAVESPRAIDTRNALLAPLVAAAKKSEPTERSKALLIEAHDLAGKATTADDFTAVVKRCRYVLAIDRSPLAKQYANSLAGWALTKRGDALDDGGRYEEARSDYYEAIRCDPECWRAEHRLGVCAARDGNLEEARRRFDRTIDINPEFAKPYSNRAALAVQAGDLEAALNDYGRAIEIDPDLAVAHSGRGRVCHMLGLLDEGLRHLDAAELLSPNDPTVAIGRADLLVDLGAYGQALTAYQRAIEINPNAVAAYRNLSWMLATCPLESFRDGAAALAHAEQAEELLGEADDLLLDTKAAALAAAGRFDEATETLQQAIDLAPESDAAAYRERLALYAEGEAFISMPVGVRHAAYNGSEVR